MWKLMAVACVFCASGSGAAQDDPPVKQPIVTSDLLKLRSVTAIDVAQDGSRAVFTIKSIAEAKPSEYDDEGEFVPAKYEYRSHLYLIELADEDSRPIQLTFGRRNDQSPRLSPDGSSVVFVRHPMRDPDAPPAKDDDKDKPQVWLLPLTGGEARQLTDFTEGAGEPRFSPLGNAILVTASIPYDEMEGVPDWPMERPEREWKDVQPREEKEGVVTTGPEPRPDGTLEEIRAWLEVNAARENPTVINRLEFQDELSLHKPFEFKQLFLVDVNREEPAKREDATQLTLRFVDHEDAEFFPDGRRIVFAAKPQTDQHIDRILDAALWSVDLEGGEETLLFSREGWKFSKPRPSMDGALVAFLAEKQDEPNYRQTQLGLVSTNGEAEREPVWLTDLFDRSVSAFDWMSARGSIVFGAPVQGAFPLYSISTGVIEPVRLLEEPVGAHVFDVGGGNVVYSLTSAANPCVLMARTARGDRELMNLNEWVHEKEISLPTEGWIDRPDGTRIQYWLMPPTNRAEGATYPLCLEIHGGPSAMWGPGEDTMWLEFQLLCSWGYGVVYCNPRGSGGYGYEFQKGNHQNWGAGPGGDVLAAVDRAIQQPWVDRERLVITGGSYAGYLTVWIIANDHRFKAAVAQRGVYDFTTFFGEGNAWRLVEWAMGGQPWDSTTRAVLQRESPFTHVRQIQTPLLIKHASSDLRTGVSQSEMLYRALKVLNRPVEYVRYPDAGHDLSRTGNPHQRMDRLNRIIEFFERYASAGRGAPTLDEPRP